MTSVQRNPYSLGPTDNARLLRTRRTEIARAVEAVGAHEGGSQHALIFGDERMGRTSVLREVGRTLASERDALSVQVDLVHSDLTRHGVARALISSVVEALVTEGTDPQPEWYRAWCDRTHLRDRSPMALRDLLVTGLALAAEPPGIIDRAVLRRDLRALSGIARGLARSRIVVLVDNAEDLLEDTDLVEALIGALDDAGGWGLVLASGTAGPRHLVEAVSPCLRRVQHVPLSPLWAPDKIRACFTAPLTSDSADRLMPAEDSQFLFDVLRLTSGNPFEIALVGQHLWWACRQGEQEFYELTPRVLDRVLGDLAVYTGASPELVAGAKAVGNLAPDRIGPALDLVALRQLTTRQVAIARLLGVANRSVAPNHTSRVSERLLQCSLDDEEARVVAELEDLQEKGVVSLSADGRFTVQGGRAAAIALKYQARSFAGPDVGDKPFDIPFIACVGEPLAFECTGRAAERVPGVERLAWFSTLSSTSEATGARLRAGIDNRPFTGLDADADPFGKAEYNALSQLASDGAQQAAALVNVTLEADGAELNLVEVWSVSRTLDNHDLNQALSDVIDEWGSLVGAAEMRWSGAHAVVLEGDDARRAICQLCSTAASRALQDEIDQWAAEARGDEPERALSLAEFIVDAIRRARPLDRWDLSIACSHLGFVLSLFEDRLGEAQSALEEARERGPADGWVTAWNLANIAARRGDQKEAARLLNEIGASMAASPAGAVVTFFMPGQRARDTLIRTSPGNARELHTLQLALVQMDSDSTDTGPVEDAIALCLECDPDALRAAKWATDFLGAART